MARHGVVLTLAVLLGCAVTGHPQSGDAEDAARSLAVAPASLPFAATFGAQDAEESRAAAQIELEAATEEKKATVTLAKAAGSTHFALKLTGALDESTGESSPLATDGLSAGSTLGFNFSHWHWAMPTADELVRYDALCESKSTTCGCSIDDFKSESDRKEAARLLYATPPTAKDHEDFNQLCIEWTGHAECSLADFTDATALEKAKKLLGGTPAPKDGPAQLRALCKRANVCQTCKHTDFSAEVREEGKRLLRADSKPMFFGGGFEVGRTGFKYLDPVSLAAQSVNRNDWQATVRAGVFLAPVGFLLGSYSYSRDFSPGAPASDVCTPIPNVTVSGAATCSSAVRGAPRSDKGSTYALELRLISAGGIGFAPSIRRNTAKDVTAVTLPLYFISAKEKGFIGGARATWQSDTEDVTVSVFVGKAFTLEP